MSSNIRSSASVARILALCTCAARATNTTRAASPPLATRMLLSPAPANVARSAMKSESAPTGRRKIHHRTPLSASDSRLTIAANVRMSRSASVIRRHVACQFTVRANSTSPAMISTLRARRIVRDTAFFIRRREGRTDTRHSIDGQLSQAQRAPSARGRREDRNRLRRAATGSTRDESRPQSFGQLRPRRGAQSPTRRATTRPCAGQAI